MVTSPLGQLKDEERNPFWVSSWLKRCLHSPFVQAGITGFTIFVIVVLYNWNVSDKNIQSAASLGDIVNIAGRQRMLSQRIAKNLLLLAENPANSHSYSELDEDLVTLNQHQQFLLETAHLYESTESLNEMSPGIILNQISPHISNLTGIIVKVLSGEQTTSSAIPEVLATEKRLMPLLDQFNKSMTRENILLGSNHLKRQIMIESLLILAITSLLFCVFWFVLLQIQKRHIKLRQEKQALIDVTHDLHNRKLQLSATISAAFHETWSWTQSTGVFWCSESFWSAFGYQNHSHFPQAEFDVFRSHIDPENRGLLESAIQQNIQDGRSFDLELCAKNQLGEFRWVRVQGKVLNHATDLSTNIVGTVEDIHEHKMDRLQLDQDVKLLHQVGKAAKTGGWHLDLETRELFWTTETYAIHEIDPSYQPTIEKAYSFYAPEARPVIQNAVEQAIEHGDPWDLELPLITAKGRHIWVRAQGELEYNDNKPIRLVGAFQDITEEKQLEAEFLNLQSDEYSSRAQLEGVIRAATEVSIIATDEQGIITLFSPGAERLLGYSASEMIGIQTPERIHLAEEVRQRGQELSASLGRPIEHFETFVIHARQEGFDKREWTYVCKDGSHRTVELSVTAIRDQDNLIEGYLGVAIDVTQRKEAEQAALAASHSKSEFLANMSHEIRTPLTAILGFTDLLQDDQDFANSPEKRAQAVGTIHEAGNHLLTVINDILDLSKIEAEKMELDYSPTHLFNILDHTENLLRPRAIEKKVKLSTILQTPIPDLINSDSTRLRQILMNLVGNAVKFTAQGSIKIIIQKCHQEDGAELLQFDIEDTGPGMSQDQAKVLFNAFSQADSSVTRQHGGTGLGLIISRKLARLMGGEVSLAWTEQGTGTCFRLVLPLLPLPQTRYLTSRVQKKPEDRSKNPSAKLKQLLTQTRILLAEDGQENQRLISFLLKKMGAIVDVADNGAIAYQKIQEAAATEEPYDLLLTDMQMPVMDGYTLAKTLRKENATLPIIALTAHAMPEDRLKCINAGCDDYLSKPINSQILVETIANTIANDAEINT